MLSKEMLYITIKSKLEALEGHEFITDTYFRGMQTGILFGIIGVHYQYGCINTDEYMELTDKVSEAMFLLSHKKKAGAYDELSNAK